MITELKSLRDIWKRMPTERHARLFLEGAIWGDDGFVAQRLDEGFIS